MTHKEHIKKLRSEFTRHRLEENTVDKDPMIQFDAWMKEAVEADLPEPNVMVLATADTEGKPSARVLLLRGYGEMGFVFYTNYHSRKASEIEVNPYAAMTFYWAALERQVRIEGKLEKISPEISDDYFNSRPYDSQIGAWASQQSSVISSRKALEENVEKYYKKFQAENVPRPPYWGGYALKPLRMEFWQGRPGRLHDRILYNMQNGAAVIERLAP